MSKEKETGADTRSIRVVKKEGRAAGFTYGTLVFYQHQGAWKFVSHVPHRRGSRKCYPTPRAALPSWIKRSEVNLETVVIVGTHGPVELPVIESSTNTGPKT